MYKEKRKLLEMEGQCGYNNPVSNIYSMDLQVIYMGVIQENIQISTNNGGWHGDKSVTTKLDHAQKFSPRQKTPIHLHTAEYTVQIHTIPPNSYGRDLIKNYKL